MSHSDGVTVKAEGPHLGHIEVDLTLHAPSEPALGGFVAVPSAQGQSAIDCLSPSTSLQPEWTADDEEELLEASGMEPVEEREAHRSWLALQTQLEADLVAAKKDNKGLTVINRLTILQNFAILRTKGFG
jgi:hypothetical protein